jgi:hypothetical protein
MNSRTLSLALVLGLSAFAAHAADPTFKSTMPDGRVIYGESPQPGAKRVDKLPAPPESAGVVVATPADKDRANSIPVPSRAGVAVIPQPVRPPTRTDSQGQQGNIANDLPKRGY